MVGIGDLKVSMRSNRSIHTYQADCRILPLILLTGPIGFLEQHVDNALETLRSATVVGYAYPRSSFGIVCWLRNGIQCDGPVHSCPEYSAFSDFDDTEHTQLAV